MGTPTASSSQSTIRAQHCHCCMLVFLLDCKSQGIEFPYSRGTWNRSGKCSFLSDFFHKLASTMVATGKHLFYFFFSIFPFGVAVIIVKPFLSLLSTLPYDEGHNIRHGPLLAQKINQCSQTCSFGLLTPVIHRHQRQTSSSHG